MGGRNFQKGINGVRIYLINLQKLYWKERFNRARTAIYQPLYGTEILNGRVKWRKPISLTTKRALWSVSCFGHIGLFFGAQDHSMFPSLAATGAKGKHQS